MMLLYTKVAPPKAPKRRSRAGCTFCKEKKKKCDEGRPCSRCAERGLDCSYEPVRPRQRRKRTSIASSTVASDLDRRTSFASTRRWSTGSNNSAQNDWFHYHCLGDIKPQTDQLFSPIDGSFDALSLPSITDLSCSMSPRTIAESAVEFEEDDHTEGANTPNTNQAVAHVSKPPVLAMISPCPVGSPLLDFYMPAFSEFSDRTNRRALVDHFCNSLSHLIVFREETGNPFQELVLPLTSKSSPVMNALYALASAHMEYRGVKNQEQSLYFHGQAIQGLAALIDQKGRTAENRNELLAAIMLLVYYEVLVQKGRSNLVDGHLKGAMTIMNSYPMATDPTGIFLERAFRFYDVIAALSFGTAPLSQAPGKGCMHPFPPPGAPVSSSLSSVDTLLGMATSLWPIIHRLSKLSSDKTELETARRHGQASTKIAVLKTEFETNAHAIERALKSWQPYLPPGFTPDDPPSPETEEKRHDSETAAKSRLHSIFNNAMAYRHSAFVYLYHTIYGYSRTHASVQSHAHTALWHCLQTCSHAGPMGALLWPLFVASCDAVTDADRQLARDAFQLVEKRQGMINIKWAWDIVQEVWRLADAMEKEGGAGPSSIDPGDFPIAAGCSTPDLWRKVSKQMGISIVFG
ncbi:Sterol regulatory element-binding protein ECM22 [Cytospora mali]|uniref:Sterol regulatory element-binding protein ECM22 n=1 Tax=Cytospora mali TaxID=578113 RepID=A0A194WBQ0_CYTMA|nr:Sterol regulatory element-binding protein ECM22 [Valsa mali]